MAQETETVRLKLDSGETVRVIVPKGMSDDEIHSLMQMQHPEMVPPTGPARPEVHGLDDAPTAPPDQSFLQKAATQPSTFSRANPLRYFDEIGQGMAGGAESMLHPLDTAKKMYHSFTTDDPNVPNISQKPLLQGLGDVADQVAQGWGQAAVAAPIAKATGRVISELTPSKPQLGSPENPGPMSKLPTRVPASVLKEEAAATEPTPPTPVRAKPGIARLLNRSSGPTEFGGGGKGGSVWNRPSPRNSAVESQSGLKDLGNTSRSGLGPRLRPIVYESPEHAQVYDNYMSRIENEAKDAGMYSAARGKVGRVPDYQERTGAAMSPFGGGTPPPSELSPPSTIRPYAPDPGTRTPDFDLVQQAAERMKAERAAGTIPEGTSNSARAQQILDELKKAQ